MASGEDIFVTTPEDDFNLTQEREDYNVTFLYTYENDTLGMYEFYAVPQIVFVSVLCVFIIVGNACVLAAIRLSENGRKSRMNFFIMHLALADLLVGVMVSLTDLATKITIEWYAGDVMCKLIQYSQAVVTYSSTYMLVSLSIDRYDAVARPMNFSRSGYQKRFLVFAAWLVSFLFALPALFLYKETVQQGKKQCWLEFPALWHWQLFVTAVTVVTFLLPAIIIATCYIAIIYIIWSKGRCNDSRGSTDRMTLNQSSGCSTPTRLTINDSRHDTGRGIIPQAKIRTIKMTLIIVIVFILCWSPFFVYNLLDVYELLPYNNAMTTLIQSAAPLNSAANPIIYGIFSTRICKNLRRIPLPSCLRGFICRCKETRRCKRRTFRGRHHLYHTSQTTDPTLTTYEANKRSKECLNDLRMSPLRPHDRRSPSPGSKHIVDRRIFFDDADTLKRREHDRKVKLFKMKGNNKWSFEKADRGYELAPLTQNNPKKQTASSGSDDSSPPTSDCHLRSTKRGTNAISAVEDCDQATIISARKTVDSNKSEKFDSVPVENDSSVARNSITSDKRNIDFKTREIEADGQTAFSAPVVLTQASNDGKIKCKDPCFEFHVAQNGDKEEKRVIKIGNGTNVHNDLNGGLRRGHYKKKHDIGEVVKDQKGQNKIGRGSSQSSNGKRLGIQAVVADRSLANRRPSGIPSVRRRLTSDDDVILSNITSQWLVNDITANESSVVD